MTEAQGAQLLAQLADLQEIAKAQGVMLGLVIGVLWVVVALLCAVVFFAAIRRA